jgi:antitoxin CcdA
MGRAKVNLTLDADAADSARAWSQHVEAAKIERNRLWRHANQPTINSYAEEVAKEGLHLASFRSF